MAEDARFCGSLVIKLGVEIDIGQAVDPGLPLIHQHALETVGPERPLSVMPPVVKPGKGLVSIFHTLGEVFPLHPEKGDLIIPDGDLFVFTIVDEAIVSYCLDVKVKIFPYTLED